MHRGEYPLMEDFYTIQGEGGNTGIAAYFIRLAGCDVGCVWCDVKDSWDAENHPVIDANEIVNRVLKSKAKVAVITGGEPAMYDLQTLTALLKMNGIRICLETSGAYPITGSFDWICVSPKKFKVPLPEAMMKADELKIIVYNKSDFEWAEKHALEVNKECLLFLQPEYSVYDKMIPPIIDYVKSNTKWRISLQTHKIMNIP
jgi:7-carboxy-7-deazaguanine synthase